jgi:hypothetical protein
MDDGSAQAADDDFGAVVAGLQDQIDALTSTLEAHQRLFERLRAQGLLTDADPDL